jgi:di/tricarboxylate transporter
LEPPQKGKNNKQMNDNVHNHLLVQAVVAKSGPLVGKTVRENCFCTTYGATVIPVHRKGRHIHEHPGNIKLHAGDVLLLEAGPTLLKKSTNNDHPLALLALVKDSALPHLNYLISAIVILLAMLVMSGFDLDTAPLLVCAVFAGVVMVVIGLLLLQEAQDAIDGNCMLQ